MKPKKAGHTSGPWSLIEFGSDFWLTNGKFIDGTNGFLFLRDNINDYYEFTANAHLIVAAPELLEAVKDALGEAESLLYDPSNFNQKFYQERYIPMLRKAIAKAEDKGDQ